MIPHIPRQRLYKSNSSKPFTDLVKYIEEDKGLEKQQLISPEFEHILDYATALRDKSTQQEKCIAIRTNGIANLATASVEMNHIAANNTRCKDPAFHFILSWPEHEKPASAKIFDAAEHAIRTLGLIDHQYVIAVHGNTDNIHCHVAVNRINPNTYLSKNIEWAKKTLHLAARQSEIKHGWTHDNGIYVVEPSVDGEKRIVLNKSLSAAITKADNGEHPIHAAEQSLPTWHDPESLDSFLKSTVARKLKRNIKDLQSWHGLHVWLGQYGIELTDTGGGGMRLKATSMTTGEILDIPASKGLRFLKRKDLEDRWGQFTNQKIIQPIITDLSHLSAKQLLKGANNVIARNLDQGRPPHHILHDLGSRRGSKAEGASGVHVMSTRNMDGGRPDAEMLLPNAVHLRVGDQQAREDQSVRRPDLGREGSERRLGRDISKREERKLQRAQARADLRSRFAQYRRFVRDGDSDHIKRVQELKQERRESLAIIRADLKSAKKAVGKGSPEDRLYAARLGVIATEQCLMVEATYQQKLLAIKELHVPALGWRSWLYEQSNLGDQAAISALRGIVYQAQRDSKRLGEDKDEVVIEEATGLESKEQKEARHRKLMARLLEEEKNELAIRSARYDSMRPYEVDAILKRYQGIQWRVTGNGNIEYSDVEGSHLFTDRGNRVTFDRVFVTDEEIRLALVHAQQKFGAQLTLTGDDPVFAERMARLATEMGMQILNPELQHVVAEHQELLQNTVVDLPPALPLPTTPIELVEPAETSLDNQYEALRAQVLSIDPKASFAVPDNADRKTYSGVVATSLEDGTGFAQHLGRGIYAIHLAPTPDERVLPVDVQYKKGVPVITTKDLGKAGTGKDGH